MFVYKLLSTNISIPEWILLVDQLKGKIRTEIRWPVYNSIIIYSDKKEVILEQYKTFCKIKYGKYEEK